MSTIQTLTSEQVATRTAAYMRRSLSDLRSLANTMGIDPTGTKAAIVARIVGKSATLTQQPKQFDYSGLNAPRLGISWTANDESAH
jgi:hypothetical protein